MSLGSWVHRACAHRYTAHRCRTRTPPLHIFHAPSPGAAVPRTHTTHARARFCAAPHHAKLDGTDWVAGFIPFAGWTSSGYQAKTGLGRTSGISWTAGPGSGSSSGQVLPGRLPYLCVGATIQIFYLQGPGGDGLTILRGDEERAPGASSLPDLVLKQADGGIHGLENRSPWSRCQAVEGCLPVGIVLADCRKSWHGHAPRQNMSRESFNI